MLLTETMHLAPTDPQTSTENTGCLTLASPGRGCYLGNVGCLVSSHRETAAEPRLWNGGFGVSLRPGQAGEAYGSLLRDDRRYRK